MALFLHDSSVAVADDVSGQADGAGRPAPGVTATAVLDAAGNGPRGPDGLIAAEEIAWSAASDSSHLNAESVALRAAAVSVSTLDRIELLAAKLEADIASAHRVQAELQAGAGAAAADAVRAAQAAWVAATTAVAADKRAKISLIKIARYMEITFALVLVAVIILVATATSAH